MWYSSTSVSNEHLPSRWVYLAPGASKLVAPSCSAYSRTSSRGTYTICASGSMNLRISHGQAMRSVLGCSRVTHFMAFGSSIKQAHGHRPEGPQGGYRAVRIG